MICRLPTAQKERWLPKGRLKASPFGFNGELVVSSFPFVDFDAYLPAGVNITLLDGKLDTKLSLDLAMQEKKLTGSFRGEGGIRDFYSVDAEEEEDLLKWESLHLEKFSGAIDPFALQISGLSLNNYYARVIVNKNGRINFQDIYRPAGKEQAAAILWPGQSRRRRAGIYGSIPLPFRMGRSISAITISTGTSRPPCSIWGEESAGFPPQTALPPMSICAAIWKITPRSRYPAE